MFVNVGDPNEKAQGGQIRVDTKKGEFTEFVVHLPNSD